MSVNTKNTGVKRILADVRELQRHPSSRYAAAPLEDNMFEWHFTIRGPKGSDFEGGIYHGRILLPPEYPFKPPNIIFTTVLAMPTNYLMKITRSLQSEKRSFRSGNEDLSEHLCLS
jgi:ubiquitin-protein ligase